MEGWWGGVRIMLNGPGRSKLNRIFFLAVGEECMTVVPTQRWDSSVGKAASD